MYGIILLKWMQMLKLVMSVFFAPLYYENEIKSFVQISWGTWLP